MRLVRNQVIRSILNRQGSRRALSWLIAGALLFSAACPAQAALPDAARHAAPAAPINPAPSIIDDDLRAALSAPGAGPLQFVVEFAAPAGRRAALESAAAEFDWNARGAQVVNVLQQSAAQAQTAARALLAQRNTPYRDLWSVNALAVEGVWSDALALAAQPNVIRVRLPRRYPLHKPVAVWPAQREKPPASFDTKPAEAALQQTAATQSLPWGLTRIRAGRAWQELGARGEGIVIGSIDTGARFTHQALVGQYRGNLGNGWFTHHYNWFDPNRAPAPFDNVGHGTHTLGTIVGDDGGVNQIGVAPRATWIAAKGCAEDWCTDVDLALAGQWMLAPTRLDGSQPDPSRRPHIVNNSWGANGWDPFYQAIVLAWRAAGIYPVFSLGNAGPACNTAGSPGTYSAALGVGATNSSDQIAAFSSRGPSSDPTLPGGIKPDVSAPGESVLSALAERDDQYGLLSGTSMAAPHVAGAIALMWSASPALIGQIISTTQILTSTTQRIPNTVNCGEGTGKVPNNTFGWGRLDAYSATLRAITSTAPSGALNVLTVISETGAPARNVLLQLDLSPGRGLQGLSDGNGALRVRAPAGQHTLSARHPSFRPVQQTVAVSAGLTTSVVISLSPRAQSTISGVVRDAQSGLPVRAVLRATSADLLEDIVAQSHPDSGAYSMTAPGGISLSIRIEALGYQPAEAALSTPDENNPDGNVITQNIDLLSYDCLAHPALCSRLSVRPLGPMNWPAGDGVNWLTVNGDVAYIVRGNDLLAVDIGATDAPRILSVTPMAWQDGGWAYTQATVTQDRLLVLRSNPYDRGYTLNLIALDDPLAPRLAHTLAQNERFNGGLFARQGYVYVPEMNLGWRVFSTTATTLTPVAVITHPVLNHTVLRASVMGNGVFAHVVEPNQPGGTIVAVSLDNPAAPRLRDVYRSSKWILDIRAQDGYVYSAEDTSDFDNVIKPIRVSAGLTFTVRPPSAWLTREYVTGLSGWAGHLAAINWETLELLSLANPDKPAALSEVSIRDLASNWPTGMIATPHRVVWHDGQNLHAIDITNRAQPRLLPPLYVPSARILERRQIARQGRDVFALSNGQLQQFYLQDGVLPRPTTLISEVREALQFVMQVARDGETGAPRYRIFYTTQQRPGELLGIELNQDQITGRGSIDLNPPNNTAPLHSLHQHNGVVFAVSEWPTPTLHALSFADMSAPAELSRLTLPVGAVVIAWDGPRLFVTTRPEENSPCDEFQLTVVLLDDPAQPAVGGSTPARACLSPGAGVAHNGWLFTQDGSDLGAMRVFSVSNPLAPHLALTTTQAAHPQKALGERLFTQQSWRDPALAALAIVDPPAPVSIPISPTLLDILGFITYIEGDFIWHNLAQTQAGMMGGLSPAMLYGVSVSTEARPGQAWRLESVGERNGQPHTRVDIPPDAWSATTAITWTPALPFGGGAADQPAPAHTGRVFTLSAETPPQRPLTLTLLYDEDELGPVPEATLGLYRWDDAAQAWQPEAGAQLDTAANRLVAQIEQPGVFALLGTPHRAYAPIVTRGAQRTEQPVTCHILSANGGFESGPPGIPWRIVAAPNDPLIYASARRSGAWGVWLGARVSYTDTIWQPIELPREALTATLRLWWRMSTEETTTSAVYDITRFGLRDTAGNWVASPISVTNLAPRNTWISATATIDVSAQAGRPVSLTLTSSNDYSKTTSWFVDDVTLTVCAPQGGWARPAGLNR